MKKRFKAIPKFNNEEEERDFWATADSSEYFDYDEAEEVHFPNLKPTSRSISIRIPEWMLDRVKAKANEINIPYQSLIKQYINKGIISSL